MLVFGQLYKTKFEENFIFQTICTKLSEKMVQRISKLSLESVDMLNVMIHVLILNGKSNEMKTHLKPVDWDMFHNKNEQNLCKNIFSMMYICIT